MEDRNSVLRVVRNLLTAHPIRCTASTPISAHVGGLARLMNCLLVRSDTASPMLHKLISMMPEILRRACKAGLPLHL